MNRTKYPIFVLCIISIVCTNAVNATILTQQTIPLIKGWNAVFLEISPQDSSPDDIFSALPIDQVFCFFPRKTSVEFVRNPDMVNWQKEAWGRWVPDNQPDSFLNTLFSILPGRAYLIHSKQDFVWTLKGYNTFIPTLWQPDSFNLKGFYVDPVFSPTFAQFFSGITGSQPNACLFSATKPMGKNQSIYDTHTIWKSLLDILQRRFTFSRTDKD